ncbi:WD repeat-containing protein 74 [Saguinus oedipus]|uniref:WD repeat-containing protein 74 n=1 Tax=Saguinus oedipus TaxID=9490 RepID=A0ABQ9UT69_SAGOE|nr:WD repeat-containing protein 74 [Saguinus oedipus]
MATAAARWNHVWGCTRAPGVTDALGQPRREESVSALCWGAGGETLLEALGAAASFSSPSRPSLPQILVGCADRTVKHFSTEEGIFQGQRHCPGGEGTFRGLAQANG